MHQPEYPSGDSYLGPHGGHVAKLCTFAVDGEGPPDAAIERWDSRQDNRYTTCSFAFHCGHWRDQSIGNLAGGSIYYISKRRVAFHEPTFLSTVTIL